MKVNKVYLEASFISFIIHGIIILYLLGFFYFESQQRSVLSKPINVNPDENTIIQQLYD